MTKKTIKNSFNPESAFKSIIQGGIENKAEPETQKSPAEQPVAIKAESATIDIKKYKQKAYYLTDIQIKAITMKTAMEDVDKSTVVRNAIDLYLKDIISDLEK